MNNRGIAMTAKKARVKWVDNLKFVGDAPSGHSILMDGPPEAGGDNAAIRPGEMTLVALGGCTGIDIVTILKKMRVDFDSFEILVDAEAREQFPKSWQKIHLKYIFRGNHIDEKKVKTAIELSEEKYCSVSAMLKPTAEITYDYQIIQAD
jgi:putative redox protein